MATIIIPNFNTQKIVSGLNTYQYTTQSSAIHTCRIEVEHRDTSTITISIVQTGSVNATLSTITLPGNAATIGSPQSSSILQTCTNCILGDTLSFVLTSSSPIDEQLNTIKTKLNIHIGGLN